MKSPLASAYVIGRRDFVATVRSRTFAFFLIGPLLIIALSFSVGSIGERIAREEFRTRIAVVMPKAEFAAISGVREQLNGAFGREGLPELIHAEPDYDVALQTQTLLAARDQKIVAVLSGTVEKPRLTGALEEDGRISGQMGLILDELRQQRGLADARRPLPPVEVELVRVAESAGSLARTRAATGQMGQLLLFMLTVFLSTMLLSNLVEEKSNKIIEVLAAAVPVDAIFVGKLFAMLAVSMVGIAAWAAAVGTGLFLSSSGGAPLPDPAVGWPVYTLLIVLYYTTNYLLLGALFLGIGAQASSVREVQTLSMPLTVGQMLVFFFAIFAVGAYNGPIGLAAAAFPFSSPLAMIARAAQTPELWPHAVALLWQVFWVWLTIQLGAYLFRRNVLKSGGSSSAAPSKRRWGKAS
jgi:ABC-2 type transport system permease protein